MSTINQIQEQMAIALAEDTKFFGGNNAAGARARKALGEVAKLVKVRRNEVTLEKNARAAAKVAAK